MRRALALLSLICGIALPCAFEITQQEALFQRGLQHLGWSEADFERQVSLAVDISVGRPVSTADLVEEEDLTVGGVRVSGAILNAYGALFNSLAAKQFPAPLKSVENKLVVITHQDPSLQKKTAEWLSKSKLRVPVVALVSPVFPLETTDIVDTGKVAVRYSAGGELPGIAAKKVILLGGHWSACLLSTIEDLVVSGFKQGLKKVEIQILPSLSYTNLAGKSLAEIHDKQTTANQIRNSVKELEKAVRLRTMHVEIVGSPSEPSWNNVIRITSGEQKAEIRFAEL
ncbi:hypothetical protein K2X33_12105 [bacterium]|nr:hypothetical protein [bacterium]